MASTSEAKPRLVKYTELPGHLQFNPYIYGGYRRLMGTKDCLKSLLYLHNESFNIYSHVFFVVYFLFSFSQYYQVWENNQSVMVSLFITIDYIATVLPFGLSVLYHTFMCHDGGKPVYQRMLRVDVAGIWLLATFGELQNIYVTLYFYHILRIAGIVSYVCLSMLIFFNLISANDKKMRSILFTIQFIFRILFLIIRHSPYGCGHKHHYYILLEVCNILGVIINALHIPERWLQNDTFNHFVNGHSLMHIIVPIGIMASKEGLLIDMKWLSERS